MSSGGYVMKLGGSDLPVVLSRGFQSLTVSASLSRLSHVEARFYLPFSDVGANTAWHGEKFVVSVFHPDHEALTIKGEIIEVSLEKKQEAIQLVLRGFDNRQKLKRTYKSKVYEGTHSDVAETAAKDVGKITAEGVSGTAATYVQANISHATMLKRLADMNNYAVAENEGQLGFQRKSSVGEGATADIPWADISRFRVTHSLEESVSEVKVVGYDPVKGELITGKSTDSDADDFSGGGSTAASLAKDQLSGVSFAIDNSNVTTTSEADAIAKGELQRRADRFVSGTFQCSLNPDARPGATLTINDAPWPIGGKFLVEEVTHVFTSLGRPHTKVQFMSDGLPKSGGTIA